MYATIVTGGKQYRVTNGDVIYIEKLKAEDGADVSFDKVLFVENDNEVSAGKPYLSGAKVTGKVIKHGKGKKITVFTYVRKSGAKRKLGHRQMYTKVEIQDIKA